MTTQNYFVVENDVVINSIMWDGNPETWTPPSNAIMLISDTTPALVWRPDRTGLIFSLVEVMGAGDIGFTWDSSVLTTNQPQPEPQPIAS